MSIEKQKPEEYNLENYTKKGILNLAKDFFNNTYKHNRDEIMAITLQCSDKKDEYGQNLPHNIYTWATIVDLRKLVFVITGLIQQCLEKTNIPYEEIRKVLDATFIKDKKDKVEPTVELKTETENKD